ncbi:RNA-dependent RNA polymerase 1-like isoform X1 [Syzygium oleosum]|uniref:RNA-dependent RNA polymerase 1-like isoform X1 n=2 Tax=Syzygium oleosum TaxID=219896 RepID=UPI0011D244DD|nr:RNA-dependent RNA polymerase 1-like isoform X1 [Syzygium oleosum]XP_056164497.1 RNA-dependent RNA polymerase 1-like isoform X1 [Syzygium oleosum]
MGKTVFISGFSRLVTVDRVREFLERRTGKDTIYAIKVRPHKRGAGSHAFVQFMDPGYAKLIISLASQGLRYGCSHLTAAKAERDVVQRPRTLSHSIEGIALHFGCQVSTRGFATLWTGVNVTVNFGAGPRKFCFLMSYSDTEYRLELSYENIWQIELHRPRGRRTMYLVIQLYGAPFIRKKVVQHSENFWDSPLYNFFKDGSDDQWVRATDFTPSACIGQSSAVCLEIPCEYPLPNFHENFVNYKETDGTISMESGSPFSCSVDLVPIVGPPRGVDLPYEVIFKINLLVQNGCLAGPCLDSSFYQMVDRWRIDMDIILDALDRLFHLKECCYEPSKWLIKWLIKKRHKKNLTSRHSTKPSSITLDAGLVYVYRVQITPCRVYFFGPEINVSNHVLRSYSKYIDNFIRISFVDEDLDKMHSTDLSPRTASRHGRTDIYERILSILKNGIRIGNKKFEFLAFSSSQLRENSAWMFAPTNGCTAATIRAEMGEFSKIRNVAKYAARLGQSLSSSTETLNVGRHEVEVIPDVENICYNFSDGIGKISEEFARKVARKCGFEGYTPSAFQIRYGGYKGVVAVDPTSYVKLSLRKSMSKYESNETKLNVLAWSKYQPCFLNRQVITLLSTLGVPDHVFEKKQRNAVDQLNAMLVDPLQAQEALDLMSPGENGKILKEMLMCGYRPDGEPFLSMMLLTFRAAKLFLLRTKTKIFLPKGRRMMGCLDETQTLEYGQVFVQYSGRRKKQMLDESIMFIGTDSDQRSVVQGNVVVAKNPCLHPGDVRVLTAVDVPALHHMVDCVVFPQKGKRPHPNECSGSDLDGDDYFVSWDSELVPHHQIEPMDYTPAPLEQLDHDVTIEEVEEYFVDYMLNDSLGIIADAHTVFADREPEKAMSAKCLELARLHSTAVDFPKTGVPAVIPPHLYAKECPDFMEKLHKSSYPSNSVIGKLFREVKELASSASSSITKFTLEMARQSYDPDMEVDRFEEYIDEAFYLKGNYDYKLGNLMEYYGIDTEAEILSGCTMKMPKSFSKRRDTEAIPKAVKSLRNEARTWFYDKGSGSDPEAVDEYAKASAWYHVTYHPSYWGCYNEGLNRDHYLSFPWCVYDKLIQIKKIKIGRITARMPTLEDHFTRGLCLI